MEEKSMWRLEKQRKMGRMRMLVKTMLLFFIVLVNMRRTEECLEKERLGLLQMKKDYFGSHDYEGNEFLPSWVYGNESNCCGWERVHCNHTSGRVTHLILQALPTLVETPMNFSLLHLFQQLKFLDLSDVHFNGSLGIEALCELKNLEELDLSNSDIASLPQCLGNLTSLRVLDLSSTPITGNVFSFITSLKSLEYLSLIDTEIDGYFSFGLLANHSKLEVFRVSSISDNLLVETESPPWFPTFQLKTIQLENCNLNAKQNNVIPTFLQYQHELIMIDFSHNELQGEFPTWLLNNNPKLETLRLTNNSLRGSLQLPTSIHVLQNLQISSNNIGGQLPNNIGKIFPNLIHINLSENCLEGNLPSSMIEMQRVQILDLSHNQFSGELARNIFSNWSSLMLLSLSYNNFRGELVPMFAKSARLQFLLLNDNRFSGELYDGVLTKSSLLAMDVSNNMLSSIPKWIGKLSSLRLLSMSSNFLYGEIPIEICNLKDIIYLDLSNNALMGTLPGCMTNLTMLKFLHMQHNTLSGFIPIGTYPLYTLDLRDNNFFGPMSSIVGTSTGANVMILLLGGNFLSGNIPNRLCKLTSLKILDLSLNKLDGPIPSCLANITFKADHSNNCDRHINTNFCFEETFFDIWLILHNVIPLYNSTLTLYNNSHLDDYYVINKLISAEFTTKNNVYTYTDKVLKLMAGLDLSGNELSGNIPPEIGNIGNINSLNLSRNLLNGSIPQSFSNLGKLESLDLSYNMLSGAIPVDMTKLNFLAIFNVSYNNLSGATPITGQFANLGEDNYRGNPGLFGYVKGRSSTSLWPPLASPSEGVENHTDIVLDSFCWGFVSSFVTVLLGLVLVLWFSPHWCRVWFHFVELSMYDCFPCFFRNDIC